MGRPEPCVLFAQTFVHPQLDEYVDEVIFAEPIVITACEFLEQNAASASPVITLAGATSPPSFALEVFVQCEGEPRFRRLCLPFLYSHSSSNVLEVEAVVTSHLVVRGSYRSLTLVVYGNTAEDLGQFNIEFDLDSSLANLVCSPSEGKLEDLPPALHSAKLSFEESISSLKSLNLPVAVPDLSIEMKQFLHFILRILDTSDLGDGMHRVVRTVVSAVSSYVSNDLRCTAITWNQCNHGDSKTRGKELDTVLTESRNGLLELYKMLQNESVSESGILFTELLEEGVNFEADLATTTAELLRDVLNQYFLSERKSPTNGLPLLSQNNSVIVGLSVVLLLCSGSESCFHFVNCGGMAQLARVFNLETLKSTAVMLMLLGVIERATRFAIGCEGFLGWWPREDENVPVGSSDGYSEILKLLLQKQRHDVASLVTYVLHRLRLYEVASRYESAVLSLLGGVSGMGGVTSVSVNMLVNVKLQLKNLLKLLKSTGSIQDPSPVAHASRSLILGETEGCLSYKATINLVTSSDCCFSNFDIDPHLLSLLKERGFLPLSAALLSSTILRSEKGHIMNIYVDIAASIEAILLSLLFCRSGLVFLLLQPEVTAAVILSLQGVEDMNKEECVPLRYASVLISKGFFCRPQDVGMITELHLRVVNAVDRLLTSISHSEELLWVLWELCGLSRSDSGRQALLALGHFPEAVLVLMEALRSAKDLEPVALNSGASPLDIAIFHSAAELFEVIVTDSMASSLGSWIQHAVELHRALHSSSPGSNKKDTPTRLLEWIDAGVVYHRNGTIGLLRYAAVLASGGDAHLTSTSILVSDSMDVENVVGDSSNGSDSQFIENLLGKLVSDKYFDGVALRDSSIAQLTTTFRILAFISENSAVAAALYEEGAVTLIYVVLVNCKFMLERSSNSYDYLVDEGAECNSTSDLLSERSREQSLVDLMIPSLVLLVTLLQKLQEAKELHRNTKLLNALLRLHREVSPKLAACAADLSSPYPVSALGLGAVCHLLVSALACWPVFDWTPGLFDCLLDSVQATSSLALGPKEACSLLCLLGDLFPEEGIWLWKNGMPSLSAIRTLAIGTLLGPQKERQASWYLQPRHVAKLLSRLMPLLEKIAQIIMHFAFTAMVVIQDMLRVFIIRIACQKSDGAVVLLRPIMLWLRDHVSESSTLSDTDVFKVYRLLDFLASLLEHPRAKSLLLREGVIGILIKALERCSDSSNSEGKIFSESSISVKSEFTQLSWCIPVSKSLAVICSSLSSSQHSEIYDDFKRLSTKDCSLILHHLLKLFQVLPVGKELLACLIAFRELASCSEGRSAFASISVPSQSSSLEDLEPERGHEQDGNDNNLDEFDWRRSPPLLCCWRNLLRSIDSKDGLLTYAIEAVSALSSGALRFSMECKNLNMEGIAVLKFLFGIPLELHGMEHIPREKIQDVCELITLLDTRVSLDEHLATLNVNPTLSQVQEVAKSLLLLLQKPSSSIKVDDIISSKGFTSSSTDVLDPSKVVPPQFSFPSLNITSTLNEDSGSSLSRIRKSDSTVDKAEDCLFLGGLADKFVWECPDSLRDRLSMSDLPTKRKMASMEGPSRRSRGDNSGAETGGPNVFSRGSGPPTASSGPTRRDTFRQRKPNTSRPPSMHVDDYVARERNVDGGASSGSNIVSSVQRGGSTGGRPPSIHVDEFIARQRERQIPVPVTVGEVTAQVRDAPSEIDLGLEKIDKSRQLKADLDDDLQEINIVFDDEESESEDRLPFPQPDDNLQPSSLIIEESSTHSIVEETEVDVNGSTQVSNLGTPLASNIDENTQSEFSSRSVSRPEIPLSREASVSSEKYFGTNMERAFFREQSDDTKHIVPVMASSGSDSATAANLSGFPSPFYNKGSASSVQPFGDSRMPPPTFYRRDSPQQASNVPLATGSQGLFDQKHVLSQPPLPPLPPPLSVLSQNTETVQNHLSPYGQPPLPTGYPLQAFEVTGPSTVQPFHIREDRPSLNNFASSTSFADSSIDPINSQLQIDYTSTFNNTTSHPILDSKYPWASISSSSRLHDEMNSTTGASRPPPPLPPMPPPFSVPSITQPSIKSSTSQSGYNQTNIGTGQLLQNSPLSDARLGTFSASGGSLTSYSPPQIVPPMLINRPASMPGPLFSSPTQHQSQNPQPSIQSLQPRPQLQPLQPPQPPHPHPSQHLRPLIQISQQQSEQGLPLLQSPIQIQGQSSQMHQQPHISPIQVYYQAQQDHLAQSQQQQQVEHVQPQTLHQQGDASQQQQDSGMTLQQYFSSPEAIQSLLSDREKLCQLLEQHPKLMQMLQERLGQL